MSFIQTHKNGFDDTVIVHRCIVKQTCTGLCYSALQTAFSHFHDFLQILQLFSRPFRQFRLEFDNFIETFEILTDFYIDIVILLLGVHRDLTFQNLYK